jgi:N-acetylneuraminic acid mutarotase
MPQDTWTAIQSFPGAAGGGGDEVMGCVYNNEVYSFGHDIFADARNYAAKYNPGSNTWTALNTMPNDRCSGAVGVIGDKAYVIGGKSPTNAASATVDVYDFLTGTWSSLAAGDNMPVANAQMASCVVGSKIHIIGGQAGSQNNHYVFDPSAGVGSKWTTKAVLGTPRYGATAAYVNGHIYVIGGTSGASQLAVVERYDPTNDAGGWLTMTPMTTARGDLHTTAPVVSDKIYVTCGRAAASDTDAHEAYNPYTNTWEVLNTFDGGNRNAVGV